MRMNQYFSAKSQYSVDHIWRQTVREQLRSLQHKNRKAIGIPQVFSLNNRRKCEKICRFCLGLYITNLLLQMSNSSEWGGGLESSSAAFTCSGILEILLEGALSNYFVLEALSLCTGEDFQTAFYPKLHSHRKQVPL